VPLIAWQPGAVPAGGTTDHISAFWDFLPTACEWAGVAIPPGIDGISYAPTLRGAGVQAQHDYLYWEFYEQGGKQAVRQGLWKAVRLDVGADREGPVELYHLGRDPAEHRDVAKEFPDVAQRLARLMDEAHTPSEVVSFARSE
jgi:arylsulfatase A-like enzyme